MIHPAPAGDVGVGHGHKVHLGGIQLGAAAVPQECLLGEPQHILEGQVRLHVLIEHLDKLVDLGDVFQAHQLLDHGLQQPLLGLDAAQVAVRIAQHLAVFLVVVAVAEDLHGIVSAEEPVALGLVDGEVLVGVIVVHVPGHVKIHAAHGVHDLAHGFPLHDDLVIRRKAHQLGDLLVKGLDALLPAAAIVIDSVDPLDIVGNIHHRIPGDGHDGGLLVGHIVAGQQHSVRVAAAACVPAQDQYRVVILALPLPADTGLDAVAVVDAVFRRGPVRLGAVSRQVRLDEQCVPRHHTQQYYRQDNSHRQQPLLPFGQAAGLFCFFLFGFLFLQTLSNMLCHGSISFLSASHALQ